jgi:hypothetical protein
LRTTRFGGCPLVDSGIVHACHTWIELYGGSTRYAPGATAGELRSDDFCWADRGVVRSTATIQIQARMDDQGTWRHLTFLAYFFKNRMKITRSTRRFRQAARPRRLYYFQL